MGGVVANNSNGLESGTTDIHLAAAASKDALFGDMPQVFKAHVTHTQSVVRLPPDRETTLERSPPPARKPLTPPGF